MDNTETTLIEFCAGYGGIGLGLARVIPNLRTIAVCEIETFAIENLIAKMEAGRIDACPVWNDLKTFPSRQFHGLVDILSAGFPCQPFSHAGLRKGDIDERHLFPYIMDAVEHIRPRFVFLENVEGLISAKLGSDCWADPIGTPVLLHVLRELERRGYEATWGVFSAAEVGAPHQRKRVFILAHSISSMRKRGQLPDGDSERTVPQLSQPHRGESYRLRHEVERCGATLWPSRPGEPQYEWEPPRVVADNGSRVKRAGNVCPQDGSTESNQRERAWNADVDGGCSDGNGVQGKGYISRELQECGQTQSPLGGDTYGTTNRMDNAELYTSCDNRVDELRLLGNGVVPATVAKAFNTLIRRLT